MALIKKTYIDGETVITADNLNDMQDAIIALEDGLFTVDNQASGEVIAITDAAKRGFRGFNIYGKTTQDGTPTPDAPVELVSVGDSGSITVSVTGEKAAQSMTIATPNGLPGIPVSRGGNYTDANGQSWISCVKDFGRGAEVPLVVPFILDGSSDEQWSNGFVSDGVNNRFECKFVSTFGVDAQVGSGNLIVGLPCDRFKYEMVSTIPSVNACRAVYNIADRAYYILFNPSTALVPLGDVAAWRAFLATSPITVLLPVLNPKEIPLSEEELAAYADLHTYRDNTTVSNDAGAWMELEYVMDAKKYIDSKISAGILEATVE